tara:strand:+ start:633 stop:788 length:156 start_codon:yes stop_codon:yes gene_type:complete
MTFEMRRMQKRLDDLEKQSKSVELLKVVILEINETLIDIKQRLLQLEMNQK